MKILQINSVVNIFSTGRITEEIGEALINSGFDSFIAYGRDFKKSKSNLIKIGTKFSLYLHIVRSILFDDHGLGSIKSTKLFIKKVILLKPDLILLHNIHGYYINYKLLFDFLSTQNIPVLWTLHDCWALTGHCAYFDNVGCNKWINGCYSCPQKLEYPKSILFDNSKSNYVLKRQLINKIHNLTFITPSNWLSSYAKIAFPNKRTFCINNGIDTQLFKPNCDNDLLNQHNIQNKIIILGCASVWSSRKGLFDFIKLSQLLDIDYLIVLIGLDNNQTINLPSNVIAVRQTRDINHLVKWYSLANVFVNPTYEDNFPTTNLESLSCGTPVITYNTGGSIETIDSETGAIVEKGCIEGLLNEINKFVRKDREEIRKLCRDRAVRLYDKNDRFLDYVNLIKSTI